MDIGNTYLKAMLDASPTMIFVVDDDVRILDCNAAALQLFAQGEPPFQLRGGDALLCLQAVGQPDGCGHAPTCREYFRSHWDLRFTHGYCPDCMTKQLTGRP